jgi:hypothetical protein
MQLEFHLPLPPELAPIPAIYNFPEVEKYIETFL